MRIFYESTNMPEHMGFDELYESNTRCNRATIVSGMSQPGC
jgi:hypothetical protein